MQQPAPCLMEIAQVAVIADPQHHQQRYMQRRRLIERLVEARKDCKQPAEQTVQLWPLESEAQRPEHEAAHGDQLRTEQPQRMGIQLATGQTCQQREAVQQVNRPIRNNRPGPERHVGFPSEHEGSDVIALGRQPGGEAVTGKEKRCQ